ncbi:hypothetical protein C6497_10060 [Candidatus Poribacteria bacterium]|nr:MAG: hypothetical protein C6497_10060 [Candidatus Poribacteria bacterium]
MIRRSFLIMLMITGICTFDFVSFAQDHIPKGATIKGEVNEVDADRTPIEGAEIKLISSDGKEYKKKSDANGKYEFTAIPQGRYTINVTKTGYRDRIGKPLVIIEGGEFYNAFRMIKGNIGHQRMLIDAELNKNKPDTKKLMALIQHISKEIGQLYELDEPTLNDFQKSVMITIETTINKEGSLLNRAYPQVSAEGNLGLLVLLLVDPDITTAFANYLTETQLQSYIDSTKKRRQQVRRTFADFFTLYLDQTLSLSPNQREDIANLLYKRTDGEMYMLSNLIFTQSLPQTIVNFVSDSTHGSFKQILTDEQYEIWQEIVKLTKTLYEIVVVDLIQFGEKEVVRRNRTDGNTGDFKIEKLAQMVLNLHTKQFGDLNDSTTERFALVNKGIVENYSEKRNREAMKIISLMKSYPELMFSAVTGQIPRNLALQKLKVLQNEYWVNDISNDEDEDVVNQVFNQITLNKYLLQNIFNVVTEPIYQQTIKETISEEEFEKYRKRQLEIETMRQRVAQKLMVEILDLHILLNTMQRKNIEEIASELTIPLLNKIALQFMFLELYLNINPDDLSPWQQNMLNQGVFLK